MSILISGSFLHTHTHTHTYMYGNMHEDLKIFVTHKEACKHNQALLEYLSILLLDRFLPFKAWCWLLVTLKFKHRVVVWSSQQAGGGATMVIPLTSGFLLLTCGVPDQMVVLFLASPNSSH